MKSHVGPTRSKGRPRQARLNKIGLSCRRRCPSSTTSSAKPSPAIESGSIPSVHGVVRWRLIDLAQWIFEKFRIAIAKQTLSRELRAMGYRKLSARPRHYAQAAGAIEDFKKRMARPVASDFVEYAVIGLLQRIRPRAQAPAKMEIRASRSS